MSKFKSRLSSDKGAVGSVETILLIALAVLSVLIIHRFIMVPLQTSAKGIGSEIEKMNPDYVEPATP